MDMAIQAINHISISEQSGVPRIAGRRITVHHLVRLIEEDGVPVDEVAEMYNLSLGQVYAALSFYYDNRELVAAFMEAGDRTLEAVEGLSEPPADVLTQVMTVKEIAQAFNINEKTVREAATKGWVYGRKSGSTWLIRRDDATERWGCSHAD
jgi:uncharacterized protein (DUF433 family)